MIDLNEVTTCNTVGGVQGRSGCSRLNAALSKWQAAEVEAATEAGVRQFIIFNLYAVSFFLRRTTTTIAAAKLLIL